MDRFCKTSRTDYANTDLLASWARRRTRRSSRGKFSIDLPFGVRQKDGDRLLAAQLCIGFRRIHEGPCAADEGADIHMSFGSQAQVFGHVPIFSPAHVRIWIVESALFVFRVVPAWSVRT